MSVFYALLAVTVVILVGLVGGKSEGLHGVFGLVIPYAAFVTLVLGVIYRVVKWAKSPDPFRIPTTCGQEKSLSWIKHDKYDNPSTKWQVFVRMFLEVVFFRSLFRNTRAEIHDGPRVAYGSTKWLWLAGLAFHWSFAIILLRHFRFFAEPVPFFANGLHRLDGIFEIGVPVLYLTNLLILGGLTYLVLRRIAVPNLRLLSLPADYFPLFLILGIVLTGMAMRHLEYFKVDLTAVKTLALGLVSFNPTVPKGIGATFYVHLFLVSTLMAYFPFSKLMHAGGVFLSPTRNMANNNRAVHHVNPWNPEVDVHHYDHWEDEFREKLKACGLPLDKEAEEAKDEA